MDITRLGAVLVARLQRQRQRTGARPDCTGNDTSFAATNPLWIARWAATPYPLPSGWSSCAIWQYGDTGTFGDEDVFNGTQAQLLAFANTAN